MARGALDDIRRIASRGAFDFRFGGSRGRAACFALYFASPRNTSRFTVEPGLWRAVPKFHNSENAAAGARAGSRELTLCAPSQIRRRLVYVSLFLPETSFSHPHFHAEPSILALVTCVGLLRLKQAFDDPRLASQLFPRF